MSNKSFSDDIELEPIREEKRLGTTRKRISGDIELAPIQERKRLGTTRKMRTPSSVSSSSSVSSASSEKLPKLKRETKKRTLGCKGKTIVECNSTPGCRFTTGNKRNFCRTTKNAAKLTLNEQDLEMLVREVSNIYEGEKRLKYVIGRIRKTKCKFSPNYKSAFTGKKFTGDGRVYMQAMDKIQSFFKYGEEKLF